MDKKFKIELPEIRINPFVEQNQNKAMFNNDFEQLDGLLSKSFIFCYLKEPASVTEITNAINEYYKTSFDRVLIYRALRKLMDKRLVYMAEATYVLSLPDSEKKDIHFRIVEKYRLFLSRLPEAFRRKYKEVNYFWIANGDGLKYVDWCCKLLNFKCEEDKK